MPETVFSLLGMLAIMAAILFAAYWATRWIARHGAPGFAVGGRGDERLRVLCQYTLGREGRVVLLQMGEHCLLLGVTQSGITLLKELDGDEAARWTAGEGQDGTAPPSFMEAMRRTLSNKQQTKGIDDAD